MRKVYRKRVKIIVDSLETSPVATLPITGNSGQPFINRTSERRKQVNSLFIPNVENSTGNGFDLSRAESE